MVKLILYGMDASPPVRACRLTFKALDLPFDYVVIDLLNKANLSEEYIAKNPQHTVPTLEEDGHFIWDSHAIIAYLASKYGKDDSLYPKDLRQRAVVDQRLHFESGVVFQAALCGITKPLLFSNEANVPKSKIDAVHQVYSFMETFLRDQPFVAGDHLTIADFSLISSVSSLTAIVDVEEAQYAALNAWIERMQQLPYYEEANGKGARELHAMIKSRNIVIVH